jgi:hypothetical protein
MSRNPFAFLATLTKEDQLLTILQAVIKKQGGEVRLAVADLTDPDTGDALFQYPSDNGAELVVRFARKGATAYFKPEEPLSEPRLNPKIRQPVRSPSLEIDQNLERSPVRHSVHSDLDLALLEEEREQKMAARAREADLARRAETGVYPWETRRPS